MKLTINIAGASEHELMSSMSVAKDLMAQGFTSGGMDLANGGGFYFELEGKEPKKILTKKSKIPINNAYGYRGKEGSTTNHETHY